ARAARSRFVRAYRRPAPRVVCAAPGISRRDQAQDRMERVAGPLHDRGQSYGLARLLPWLRASRRRQRRAGTGTPLPAVALQGAPWPFRHEARFRGEPCGRRRDPGVRSGRGHRRDGDAAPGALDTGELELRRGKGLPYGGGVPRHRRWGDPPTTSLDSAKRLLLALPASSRSPEALAPLPGRALVRGRTLHLGRLAEAEGGRT